MRCKSRFIVILAIVLVISGCQSQNRNIPSEYTTSEQMEYGNQAYLSNMLFHNFVRKGVTGKKLKNPRIFLKTKNYNIKEYDWYKYMPDIQEQIKKIKLKNVTDKNYLDEYLRINKEFKKRVLVPRGFISADCQQFGDISFFDYDINKSQYEWEMSLNPKNRSDAKTIEAIKNTMDMFRSDQSPYGTLYYNIRKDYSYEDLQEIFNKFRQRLIDVYGCDEISAIRLYYKIVPIIMSVRGYCGIFRYKDADGVERRYEKIVNKDITRQFLWHILFNDPTYCIKKEDLDQLLVSIDDSRKENVKQGVIDATVEFMHELANYDKKRDKRIAEEFDELKKNDMQIPVEKWKEEHDHPIAYCYTKTIEDKIYQCITEVFLDDMFILDIAYDDVGDYAHKEGEPDIWQPKD